MKGNPQVIDTLNALLVDELAARDQYLAHARMLQRWGYAKIAARIAHEVEDETLHADTLIKRILFLEGAPNMTPSSVRIGQSVVEMFQLDLGVERKVRDNLANAIFVCEAALDYGTRDALMPLLNDTERDHIDWLEQQLGLIQSLGLSLYLQQQLS